MHTEKRIYSQILLSLICPGLNLNLTSVHKCCELEEWWRDEEEKVENHRQCFNYW